MYVGRETISKKGIFSDFLKNGPLTFALTWHRGGTFWGSSRGTWVLQSYSLYKFLWGIFCPNLVFFALFKLFLIIYRVETAQNWPKRSVGTRNWIGSKNMGLNFLEKNFIGLFLLKNSKNYQEISKFSLFFLFKVKFIGTRYHQSPGLKIQVRHYNLNQFRMYVFICVLQVSGKKFPKCAKSIFGRMERIYWWTNWIYCLYLQPQFQWSVRKLIKEQQDSAQLVDNFVTSRL